MINIVHIEVNCNDKRKVTSISLKLKRFKNGSELNEHQLVATVSAAFYKTTLLADAGKALKTALNPKRSDIINLIITFKDNNLAPQDISNFINAFQNALDETSLF